MFIDRLSSNHLSSDRQSENTCIGQIDYALLCEMPRKYNIIFLCNWQNEVEHDV